MKTWFKKHFAVSELGAETLQKATFACFLTDLWNMTPVILLMFLADQLLNHRFTPEGAFSPLLLCLSCILILLVLYVLLSKEYVCLYDATYKESANLRKEIAGNLADLPIAYFSGMTSPTFPKALCPMWNELNTPSLTRFPRWLPWHFSFL